MRPEAASVLTVFADLINRELTATMSDSYGLQQLVRGTPLLSAIGEEFDRAASRRVLENRAIRLLFAQAAPHISNQALASELNNAAQGCDDDLRVTCLDQSNQSLRRLLIQLQIWAESSDVEPAAQIRKQIWIELLLSTQRRKLSLSRF